LISQLRLLFEVGNNSSEPR